jgi:hypothetical protein
MEHGVYIPQERLWKAAGCKAVVLRKKRDRDTVHFVH